MEIDSQHEQYSMSIGRAYSALGDPDMALAYFDLAKALTAPDNKSEQHDLLVEQAIIRLVSGKEDVRQLAELIALPSVSRRYMRHRFGIFVFVDLAIGRPADALARIETATPKCLGASSIPEEYTTCPTGLIRVYQELGDHIAAQDLGDAIVQRSRLWSDGWPDNRSRLHYTGALAVTGRTEEALDVLQEMVSSGWRGDYTSFLRFTLCCDVIFDSIRDHKRFQAIVDTIEADMAQQLESVRVMERNGEVPTLEELLAELGSAEQ